MRNKITKLFEGEEFSDKKTPAILKTLQEYFSFYSAEETT
jgi:hypothetical protein